MACNNWETKWVKSISHLFIMVESLYKVTVKVTVQNRVIAQLYKYQLYVNLLCLALKINPNKMLAVSGTYTLRGFYWQSTDKCLIDGKTCEQCRLDNMQWQQLQSSPQRTEDNNIDILQINSHEMPIQKQMAPKVFVHVFSKAAYN